MSRSLKSFLRFFSYLSNSGGNAQHKQKLPSLVPATAPLMPNKKASPAAFRDEEFIQRLHEILETHFHKEELTVPIIADNFPMHESHLRRRTRKTLGKSPQAYLIEFRLEKAKEKLNQPQLSIKSICFDCGFKTEGHFSHAFKRKYGRAPRDFR
jgi:AraC-like DNA-binding protein